MTASEILSEYHGKFVRIKKVDGTTIIGRVMAATAMSKPTPMPPKTISINLDVIKDMESYKREGEKYKFIKMIIQVVDIDEIQEYYLSAISTHLSYQSYQDIESGINPTAKWEMVEEIKRNKQYIVNLDGLEYIVVLDQEENLCLTRKL